MLRQIVTSEFVDFVEAERISKKSVNHIENSLKQKTGWKENISSLVNLTQLSTSCPQSTINTINYN